MATVWLTYAWDDNENGDVDYLAQELGDAGLDVKLDRWNIRAGERLWDQIERFIQDPNECDAWVMLISPNSLGSEPCREEYSYALDRALNTRGDTFAVIGLVHGSVDHNLIPAGIRTRLYVDTTDPNWKERIKAAAEGRQPNVARNKLKPYQLQRYDEDGAHIIEVRPRAGAWYPFIVGIPLYEKEELGQAFGGEPFMAIPGAPGSPPKPQAFIYRVDGSGTAQVQGTEWWILNPHEEATPRRSYYIIFQELPSRLLFGMNNGPYWIENIGGGPNSEEVKLKNPLTFKRIDGINVFQSDSFLFTKEELEYIFDVHETAGADIHSKIENHEHISLEMPQDRRIKIHFWVVNGTDDQWVMDVTMPPDAELSLPKQIVELLQDKEPIDKD